MYSNESVNIYFYSFESIQNIISVVHYEKERGATMTIGAKIKEVRTHFGLTQKKLAEKSGLAEITIRQYESGKREPKIEALIKIANALNVAIVVFLDESLEVEETNDLMTKQRACDMGMSGELTTLLKNGEIDILHLYRQLNDIGQEEAEIRVFELTKIPKYQKDKK